MTSRGTVVGIQTNPEYGPVILALLVALASIRALRAVLRRLED